MDTQRLILVLALGLILYMIWDKWQIETAPRPTETTRVEPAASATPVPDASLDVPEAAAVPQTKAGAPGVPQAAKQELLRSGERISVKTDVFHAEIDTVGGDLRIVDLLRYPIKPQEPDKPFRLMNDTLPHLFIAQSGFASKRPAADGALTAAPNHYTVYQASRKAYQLSEGEDALTVELVWNSPDGVRFTKRYRFGRDSYLVTVDTLVENRGRQPWRGNLYQQFQRSKEEVSIGIGHIYTYTGGVIYTPEDKYQKISFGDMEDENLGLNVTGGWQAFIQHYFLGAWVPPGDQPFTFYSRKLPQDRFVLGMTAVNELRVEPGSRQVLSNRLYVGPKVQSVLEEIAPGLELTVDYGMLTIIAKPLFWLLEKFHALVGNWGWAIILLTMLIKAVFYKLSETSYKSMANMRKVTPRMQALKERFGSDRQKLNQAMMELYKKEKINPMGGCLPILVQIPVFIALYWVLLESVELRQAPWILWIQDLSAKDPYFVLPILMGLSMFIQQKLNPTPVDPIQAKVMMALPLVFTVFFLFFPSGLVLYWVVNNTLSIAQQWYITRVVVKA
ncbi:MAG TPA: membrane protein insertase YidC [Chromatiales bacterium]|nr:membrane protein insertase YidC [Chromatiales bacterium]